MAEKSNAGQNILNRLKAAQITTIENREEQLSRIAFKMATGTGKTVVMGALILYHFFNRQDTRFADYFLIIAPGIAIRDRLGVLFVNKRAANKNAEMVNLMIEISGMSNDKAEKKWYVENR